MHVKNVLLVVKTSIKTVATLISSRESTVIIKNCSLKKCISKHVSIISLKTNGKLLPQKMYFKI